MKKRLIDHYREASDDALNTNEKQDTRRDWLRAVIETLHDRALTDVPVPVRRKSKKQSEEEFEPAISVRYVGFWHNLPDDELYELAEFFGPYFKRAENRGQPL